MEEQIIIDNSNFSEYFFDARTHAPKKGQVLAKFCAVAVFVDGPEKLDVINLLVQDKASQAAAVMQRIHSAKVPDNYRVCAEICEDLLLGVSVEDVLKKEYEFTIEAIYYTNKEYVPKNDPNWSTINILDYDKESGEFQSKIEI